MNQHVRPSHLPGTTKAAEGLERRRFTVAEIEAMVAAGIIPEHERFELIGGEVVPMASKGIQHETLKSSLNIYWARRLPEDIRFAQETTFRLGVDTFVEPDFVFWRTKDGLANLKPQTALLAVEVADSSLGWDLGRKALIYASFAVREVWVINARTLTTHIFQKPADGAFSGKRRRGPRSLLEIDFAPALNLRLSDLEKV